MRDAIFWWDPPSTNSTLRCSNTSKSASASISNSALKATTFPTTLRSRRSERSLERRRSNDRSERRERRVVGKVVAFSAEFEIDALADFEVFEQRNVEFVEGGSHQNIASRISELSLRH